MHLDRTLPGTVVHNPRSNLNNAVGYGRPARFPRVALGTDGIGADMLDEFRLAFALARADDVTATPDTAWSWLETGYELVPEALADVVVVDLRADRAVASGVHNRRASPSRWKSTARSCSTSSGPTRVDAAEIRARAAEQAVRMFAALEEL